MQLVHYSKERVDRVESREQEKDKPNHKPKGFWVSDEECEVNWRTWCEGERFQLENLAVRHFVRLRDDARILVIDSAKGLDRFTRNFAVEHPALREFRGSDLDDSFYVDWHRVAGLYQGVIITPYQQSRRYSLSWYYTWDCASGCIWDASAIESLVVDAAPRAIAEVAS
jgi:hypothetical protein